MEFLQDLSSEDKARLDALYQSISKAAETFAGYPCNKNFDYSELYPFLKYCINNVGDPFENSNYRLNTHQIEQDVIRYFAKLLKAEGYFRGYVSHGGTEGNLFGIELGFQRFPNAVFYHSERSHYSIDKIARILRVPTEKIPALKNGEIDYDVLAKKLAKNKQLPAVICLNIGTTMTGAIDNLQKVQSILKVHSITDYHLHADAALSGMILPFVDKPEPFNFADGIQSIAISGHKFIGSPLPCGIALTNQKSPEHCQPSIAYVKIVDSTISGSRNGITPLFLWYAIKRNGFQGYQKLVQNCLEMADYAVKRFNESGIPAWKNPNSITVVFPKPSEALEVKWQLATYQDIAHMITMPHVTKDFVEALLSDL